MQFDLVDILLFVNVAETNSVTHGAERSNMSPPAASIRIKNLEERLGMKLLYRTSHGVTLTQPGQALLDHGRVVLQQLEHLRGDLQDHLRGVRGHLRVRAHATVITAFLPPILRDYLASHPDVSVDLREQLSHDTIRAIADGTTDIGIVARCARTEGLELIPYRRDRLVVVTAAAHPLAAKKTIAFAETLEFDQVGLQGSLIHACLPPGHVAHRPLKHRIQVANFEALCRMVDAEVGIGILPESSASRHASTLGIRIIPLSDPWALRQLEICVRKLDVLPTFAKEFVDLLIADADRPRTVNERSVQNDRVLSNRRARNGGSRRPATPDRLTAQ